MNITCDWIQKLSLSSETSSDQSRGSDVIQPFLMVLPCVYLRVFVCMLVAPYPPFKHPMHFFFLVCGKQMKNLGRKAVSACLLKRTIFARGKCCSSCAAERARKRVDGTYSLGVTGTQGKRAGTVGTFTS